ncbi:mitochondrial import receptor subunit TOM6-like protein [Huso huso]|uniref:Mitochondrial import receptor subunit TOM6 homolog n=2 Tax=Acipenseridae TaxID=7900 RepID=A0AAD8FPG2_ACIOX|nr:mitochondrial import receptor subunit TOM6 homolog [Acipenser ruthenus]KAK1152160.1 hypothetical protein AOXY_G31384 [Acipenser oxyrinchus oxyrinchus]
MGPAEKKPARPAGIAEWIRAACRFATDRNDFRRNVLVNLGLFAAGVWVAKNVSDFDLMAPQPI